MLNVTCVSLRLGTSIHIMPVKRTKEITQYHEVATFYQVVIVGNVVIFTVLLDVNLQYNNFPTALTHGYQVT